MKMSVLTLLVPTVILSIFIVVDSSKILTVVSPEEVLEETRLNFTQIAQKYGRTTEEHDVNTDDGYILKVFRFPGDKTRPVFLMHGLMGSAEHFILRGNTSLGVTLSRAGYDVWIGNFRGNLYSRRHVNLVPDRDPEFWNFGPDEHACSDLPAMFDYVLEKTNAKDLNLIGYSEGTVTTFILLSTKPEYNDKIRVFVALAPVAFLNHLPPPYPTLLKISGSLDRFLKKTHQEELGGYFSPLRDLISLFCSIRGIGYLVCTDNLIFGTAGSNPSEYEPEIIPTMIAHGFTGTSRKNLMSLANIANHKVFGKFDYGTVKNLRVYGKRRPPQYDLSKVRVDTHLFVGKNDKLATLENVNVLKRKLYGKVFEHVMEPAAWNHLDYIWGKENHKIITNEVLNILNTYNTLNQTLVKKEP